MPELGRPAIIAIGFAIVALLTSLVAVIVVARRGGEPVVAAAPAAQVIEHAVDASEISKLKRDVVERVTDDHGNVIGVTLKDDALAVSLGLEIGDVITALGGRVIKREYDVYDAVLGASQMDATLIYVDVIRAKRPVVMRWKIAGELRARRDPIAPPNPFLAPPASRDPLYDSVKKIDDLHYEVPRVTLQKIFDDPDTHARQARIVPSMSGGRPVGFKLYAIRPGSLYAAIGIDNGDTLRAVNGMDLTLPDKALETYTKLKDADGYRIDMLRRDGTEETIVVTISK